MRGPRFEVNVRNGEFVWPYSGLGQSGDVIFKRLQVHNEDLGIDSAKYFIESHVVAFDDAQGGGQDNNVSYRRVSISPAPNYNISFIAGEDTQFQLAGIYAWAANEPGVKITAVSVPGGGTFLVGYKASDNQDGTWHYEYAVHNASSDRSAGSFSVPVPEGTAISNIGFHDVDYHSGEPYDGTDWEALIDQGSVNWSTNTYDENTNANALRWGTLYNFRFDADAPPEHSEVTLELFKPGVPASITVPAVALQAPSCLGDVNEDGAVDAVDLASLLGSWGPNPGHPAELNSDGVIDAADLAQLLGHWGPCD